MRSNLVSLRNPVLGDAEHRMFKPPVVSKKIRITVI
jgi:hypothetical protein